jgi:tight adherence protein C
MLAVVTVLFALVAVSLAVLGGGRFLAGRPTRVQRRGGSRLREFVAPAADDAGPDGPKADGGAWEVVSRLGRWLVPQNRKDTTDLTAKLALAGFRRPAAAGYFVGLQLVLVVALAGSAGTTAVVGGSAWPKVLLWAAGGGAVGLLAPSFWLSGQVKKRQRLLRNALPDALDIMVLSVEGGASLGAALNWVAEEIPPVHPALGTELILVQREVQLGLSAGEAFQGFADRCGIPEARDLAGALIQSEKYGASIGKALRTYSDNARQERQLWAEEVAQKAAVKILFPMLLCIFPAMFIVLLGPAAFQMSKMFVR